MKKTLVIFFILFGINHLNAQCGITFNVSPNSNLGINSVLLELNGTAAHAGFSVGIDWGDGSNMSIGFEEDWVHTYSGPGTYEICVTFVAPTCVQENFCDSYTITNTPQHANLCPINVSYALNGNTLDVNISGSGAGTPSLSFHHDILYLIDNPFDISGFQFENAHSGSFSYTYSPPSSDATYIFCTAYSDLDSPEACESNDYCSSVTFGNPSASIEEAEATDFLSTIQVFPVPATTFINVHFSEVDDFNDVKWEIISAAGKTVQNGTIHNQESTILLPTTMDTGNYRLVLTSDQKKRVVNFVKQ